MSSAESAEAYRPTYKASVGYSFRIHPRLKPWSSAKADKKEVYMISRITIGCILACLVLTLVVYVETTRAQGHSPHSPIPVGVPIVAMIECGEGYTSLELYDVKITLLEIVRGEKAWKRIKEASMSNGLPNVGFEYILGRIKFEFFKRGFPGDKNYELRGSQFTAFSINGKEYKTPPIVQPKPELSGRLRSGDSLVGWVTFQVAIDDNKPLMTFTVKSGGAVEHGGDVWFQLY
jgi:hypothetical protein